MRNLIDATSNLYEEDAEERIHRLCEEFNVKPPYVTYSIIDNDTIDIQSLQRFSSDFLTGLAEFPLTIRNLVGEVVLEYRYFPNGFPCRVNKVYGRINMIRCQIEQFDVFPEHVTESVELSGNFMSNLKGSPKFIGDTFECRSGNLESLEGCPKRMRKIDVRGNQNLLPWEMRYVLMSQCEYILCDYDKVQDLFNSYFNIKENERKRWVPEVLNRLKKI